MLSINALFLGPDVNDWLTNSRDPRILHVFDQACNLINERKEVLSVVTSQIGYGPFNLVIEKNVCFSEHLNLESPVIVSRTHLYIGDLNINAADAKPWFPRPDWKRLHAKKEIILPQLTKLPITNHFFSNSPVSSFSSAVAIADIPSVLRITSQLAGLGAGLTPAGDDFIMGAIYAVWIIHPLKTATVFTREIAETAAPLTTSLSAAWLRSAGKGDAGILWHEFFEALLAGNTADIQLQITRLLSVGETSGADALAGLLGTLRDWAELASPKIS